MSRRGRVHHALVISTLWHTRPCTRCFACSTNKAGEDKVNRGSRSGYCIYDEGAHGDTEGHLKRVHAGRADTEAVRERSRAGGIPYSEVSMVRHTTHRCQACSLDVDSNPKARYYQMASSDVEEHVRTEEHHRRLLDGRWETFAARGVAWVCPPPVPGG